MTVSANVSTWYTISSPELWLQGKAMGVCSFRFEDGSDAKDIPTLSPVRSTSAKPVMASYLTKDFPVSARGCAESNSSGSATCDQPHTQERLWVIDIKAVYGGKFLSGADLKHVSADELTKIRAACNDSYKRAGGTISEARPMSYRFFSELPTTGPRLPIVCTLSTKNSAPDRTFSAF